MGRLPDSFAGQRITLRSPYVMSAVTQIATSASGIQVPPDVFTHSTDQPFEIHRLVLRAYSIDAAAKIILPQPSLELLFSCIQIRVQDYGKTQEFSKSSTPMANIIKSPAEIAWEWAEPYTLIKDSGLIVTLDSLVYPFTNDTVRVSLAFIGNLITLAPASEQR